jgi:hypothetical protein
LPFVLAAGAVGVHFAMHVPDAETLGKIHESIRRANAPKPRAKSKRVPKQVEARTPEELERLWARYREIDFVDEPPLEGWSNGRRNVNRAFNHVRRTAFADQSEVSGLRIMNAQCKTVRCRFEVAGPDEKAVKRMSEALAQLRVEDHLAWQHFVSRPLPPRPVDSRVKVARDGEDSVVADEGRADEKAGKAGDRESGRVETHAAMEFTVTFAVEEFRGQTMTVPDFEPATPDQEAAEGGSKKP